MRYGYDPYLFIVSSKFWVFWRNVKTLKGVVLRLVFESGGRGRESWSQGHGLLQDSPFKIELSDWKCLRKLSVFTMKLERAL